MQSVQKQNQIHFDNLNDLFKYYNHSINNNVHTPDTFKAEVLDKAEYVNCDTGYYGYRFFDTPSHYSSGLDVEFFDKENNPFTQLKKTEEGLKDDLKEKVILPLNKISGILIGIKLSSDKFYNYSASSIRFDKTDEKIHTFYPEVLSSYLNINYLLKDYAIPSKYKTANSKKFCFLSSTKTVPVITEKDYINAEIVLSNIFKYLTVHKKQSTIYDVLFSTKNKRGDYTVDITKKDIKNALQYFYPKGISKSDKTTLSDTIYNHVQLVRKSYKDAARFTKYDLTYHFNGNNFNGKNYPLNYSPYQLYGDCTLFKNDKITDVDESIKIEGLHNENNAGLINEKSISKEEDLSPEDLDDSNVVDINTMNRYLKPKTLSDVKRSAVIERS